MSEGKARGRYIVIEGGEGSGKDEQLARLVEHLRKQGKQVVAAREPGTTEFAEKVRKEMLTSYDTSALTQLLVVNAARSDTIEHIKKLLKEGTWVVCTRNWLSSFALQGKGMGLNLADVSYVSAIATQGIEPDKTIILDVDVKTALKRRKQRGGPSDNYEHRYENENLEFHQRVREAYLEAAKKYDYEVIDARGTKEEVAVMVRKSVKSFKSSNPIRLAKPTTATAGVYSNLQIKQAIKEGHIVFHPMIEDHIAGSSVDVTLGEWYYRTEKDSQTDIYNPFDQDRVAQYFQGPHKAIPHNEWAKLNHRQLFKGIPEDHPIVVLRPGERILAHTHEFIGIKPPGTSTMQARSSWGRNGVAVCLDAGWGDPGYINRWTMEIYNMNQHDSVVLPVGERIAQMVFYTTGPVEGDYSKLTGKYQPFEGYDLDGLVKDWRPQQMLPRSYNDTRMLPLPVGAHDSSNPEPVAAILKNKTEPSRSSGDLLKTTKTGALVPTAEGAKYLQQIVTDDTGDVYAFKGSISSATVAAAMARLSRRADDMRITLLDEFVDSEGMDEALLQRVITAYGDDSVQQLAGMHFVVENASNLLTKKLEWGRLAAYLEQSTRYIYFDQKDNKGNYKYYTPKQLDAVTARQYEETMNTIFDTYSSIARELTGHVRKHSKVSKKERDGAWKAATRAQACDAARPVLPVSTKSTVGVYASAQAAESLYMHLMSDELVEARETGEALLRQLRDVMPVFFERADKPERGGANIAYRANTRNAVRQLVHSELPQSLSPDPDDVQLIDFWPKNELDLLPHMLFEHSSLPLDKIEAEVAHWSYEAKLNAFRTYIGQRLNRRHKPGRAIENSMYVWELVCDYGIFRDLQRHRMVNDLQWQELTPRYGYEVPEIIEEANLSHLFEKCFDLSYQLYSKMQAAGFEVEAQYATLLGHRMRWKISYNAREAFHLHELRTAPQGHPGYRKLVKKMHDKVADIHPLLAESMIFVNQDEDPDLSRLAAEKYAQYKLEQLDSK